MKIGYKIMNIFKTKEKFYDPEQLYKAKDIIKTALENGIQLL